MLIDGKNDMQTAPDDSKLLDTLRECEDRTCLLSENIADVISTFDTALNITFVSRSVARLLEYTPEEIKKTPLERLLVPASYKTAAALFRKMLKSNGAAMQPQVLELEYVTKSGSSLWAEVKVTQLYEAGGRVAGLLGMTRDITERRRAEDDKNRLEERLMRTQRLETVGTLAGGIAHDFNNILTTINGYCELLMKDLDERHPLHGDLVQIRVAAARGESLVRQLLTFTRRQQMQLVTLNINDSINAMLKMLDRLIGENITISTDLDPNLWPVKGDAGRIEQIIMNLAVNARDAMSEGGKISIHTENVTVTEEQVLTMEGARAGQFVCLSVADSGKGIEQDMIDRIFEPFFTTKGEGAGLGLATVHGIVLQHKGWITVASLPGTGAVFTLYLPALSAKLKEDEPKKKKSLKKYNGNHERILLVEDDAAIREVTLRTLTLHDYIVMAAADAEEALEIFRQENGNFNLIVSDVVMPGKSGLELAIELQTGRPDMRIILSSGYADDKSHWPEIRKRGYRFIRKPFTVEELLKNIKLALQYG
jgi:PAS domain S-box-containing protein